MTNSFVKNNIVYNENVSGIFVSDSYNNQIVKNTISNSAAGIFINTHASNNQISENTIINSKEGITIDDDDAENLIHNNKVILDNQDKSDKNSLGKSKLQSGKSSQNKRNN
jgi:parallel beta-helix repeat protein